MKNLTTNTQQTVLLVQFLWEHEMTLLSFVGAIMVRGEEV